LTHQRASRSSITSRDLDYVSLLLLLLLLFFLVFFSFFFSFTAFSLERNSLNSAHISRGIVVERLRRTNLMVMVDDPVLGHRSFHAHSAVACVGLFAWNVPPFRRRR
jgi:hypothetical protein